jgi:hypothetical protein
MAQIVTCPECTKALQVPDELIGKTVQCPECKNTFTASLPTESDRDSEPVETKTTKSPSKNRKARTKVRDRDDDDDDRDDADDDIDIARRSRRRGEEKPGKVLAIGIMMLIGGIIGILYSLTWAATCFGLLWPGTYYSLVMGILAIVRGAGLLGGSAQQQTPPTGTAVMMIINIINLDVTCCVLGVVCLIFCNDEEVTNYLAR